MSGYRYCSGCKKVLPDSSFTEYEEPENNWVGLRCENGCVDESEPYEKERGDEVPNTDRSDHP